MIFKQKYLVEVEVTGKSTSGLEQFENILKVVCNNDLSRKNVKISLHVVNVDGIPKGKKLIMDDNEYSFIPYMNGVEHPEIKPDSY